MNRPEQVNAILSFTIDWVNERDRVSLQELTATLLQANPAFRIEVNARESRLVVDGEDELHLTEIRDELLRRGITAVGELMVNYRETIRKPAEAEGKYIRQTGGTANYGHCKIRFEPGPRGSGYRFINEIPYAVVPTQFIQPIDEGIRNAMKQGILANYPVVDVKATLFDGSWHEVDSNEMAFRFAGWFAFKEAARKASPILLEPVMSVEAAFSERDMGVMVREINARRGRIESMDNASGMLLIKAVVPLAETLSSSAQGRPAYPMQYAGYEPAPSRPGDFDDDATVPARKPSNPKPRIGSAASDWAGPEAES